MDHGPQDHGDILGRSGERLQLSHLILDKAVPIQQIHRGISGQSHFGKHDQVGSSRTGFSNGFFDDPSVAREITDSRIHLCKSHSHNERAYRE